MLDTPVLVLTGGPCGGKDTIRSHLVEHFMAQGYAVDVIHETATDLIARGDAPWIIGNEEFQRRVLIEQLFREEQAQIRMRHVPGKKVIFANRGTMDGLAYIEPEKMRRIWKELNHHAVSLRDARYAGVIHLVTVAIGLPHLYSCANNQSRYEATPDDAARTDQRTLDAWMGCPHFAYIDNSTDFAGKIARVIAWAEYFLAPLEHERKWRLLVPFDRSDLPAHAQCIDIRQSYIKMPGIPKHPRIRMRGQEGNFLHTHTVKNGIDASSCDEDERYIPASEYAHLHGTYSVPKFQEVVKSRWCFLDNGHYWELDVFRDWKDDVLLEGEFPRAGWDFSLPSFYEGRAVEVTGDKEYMNKAIARKIAARAAAT